MRGDGGGEKQGFRVHAWNGFVDSWDVWEESRVVFRFLTLGFVGAWATPPLSTSVFSSVVTRCLLLLQSRGLGLRFRPHPLSAWGPCPARRKPSLAQAPL